MAIKLIALDLDGTTLNSNRKISDDTMRDLQEAHDRGYKVVIATGRNYEALPSWIKDIEFFDYIITSNGAQIRNLVDDGIEHESHICPHKVEELHEFLYDSQYMVEIFTGGKGYIGSKDFHDIKRGDIPYRLIEYVVRTRNPVDNIFSFMMENKNRIENVNIFAENFEKKKILMDKMMQIEDVNVTTSMAENVEIGGKNATKAKAIEVLGDMLGIDKKQVIAMGDSHNDIEMIKFAAIGVAMGNAEEDVKKSADYVTDTNDENGVGKALRAFSLI